MKNGYLAIWNVLKRYWKLYGGCTALIVSPYVHLSVLLTVVTIPLWLADEWAALPIQILPNIVGFSLGGYAIWLGIGDEKFRAIISGEGGQGQDSPFMRVNATFVHFILCQMLAIILAIVGQAKFGGGLVSFFSIQSTECLEAMKYIGLAYRAFTYFVFIYAIFAAIAATLAIFKVGEWYDKMQTTHRMSDSDG